MRLHAFLLTMVLAISSLAQETAPSHKLIVAAIGEIPIPKMKVVENDGFRGYAVDEESTNQWFPQDWMVDGNAVSLSLNVKPAVVNIPVGKNTFGLAPQGSSPKPQALPAEVENAVTVMVIFNKETKNPWHVGFATRFISCTKLSATNPTVAILNLSGAALSVAARDRKIQQIAPGKSAVAAVFVDPKNKHKFLPLSAAVDGTNYSLSVVPLDTKAPWCPVVVVYPSVGPTSKVRPLQVSVIQPSDAVQAEQPIGLESR